MASAAAAAATAAAAAFEVVFRGHPSELERAAHVLADRLLNGVQLALGVNASVAVIRDAMSASGSP